MIELSEKRCTGCCLTKAVEAFSKRKMSPDGLSPKCKECAGLAAAKHYRENRTKMIQQATDYYNNNREKVNVYRSKRQKHLEATDINYRLSRRLRTRVYHALTGYQKASTTMELVGCSLEDLKTYLEAQFEPGMTWDNYGEWHVDHCYPLALIDLSSIKAQRQAFNYLNLRPLWAQDNVGAGGAIASAAKSMRV